ncbi:MAG TPA: hypothetical protein VK363_00570 [Pyrinomonadaceae bacterium]|nr:hypothetical protein [Pyrinomonadaceae bacterium]
MIFDNISRTGWKRTGIVFSVVIALSATIATLIVLASSARIGTGADKEKAVRSLERMREKYVAVKSVHLVADVKLTLYGSDFRTGSGTFEYWAEGERYKIKSRTDKHLGLKSDSDAAYDGKRYYFLDPKLKVLSYQQKDVPKTFAALPNPLFLPVDYLSDEDDDCVLCAPRLSDFKTENVRVSNRIKSLLVKSEQRDQNTGELVRDIEMPGGKTNNQAIHLALRMLEVNEERVRPLHIKRITPDGKVISSLSFADFTRNALGDFPRAITVRAFDEKGDLALLAEFIVRTLEVNEPLASNTFTISFDEAESVWDSDGRTFVKEKGAASPRPKN